MYSEMSSQIIPLKGRSDSWHHSEFRSQRLFACELRRRDTRLGPSVQDRGRGDVTQSLRWQELRRSSTDPEMIRLRPNLATPSLPQELRRRRRCEETAARTVRTPAAPELAVGRRLSFAEWHHL